MVRNNDKTYIIAERSDYALAEGDFLAWSWYSILKNYTRLCKRDNHGYTRVSSKKLADDWGVDRQTVWRYNRKLEDKGLIRLDRGHRGGRTWVGFKLV
jgi:biotin operon repressor